MELRAGDRIILKSSPVDVLTLRRSRDFDIGISRTSTPLPEEHDVVETMISTSHPSIGGRLADIPFLNRPNMRVHGITRFKHMPRPHLARARLRRAAPPQVPARPRGMQGLTIGQAARR